MAQTVNILRTRLDPGKCRNCGAPIRWATNDRGNKVPLDWTAEPLTAFAVEATGVQYWQFAASALHFVTCRKWKRAT